MSPIKILDERTVNKIAAGEVIERPASVVKELIENSLDAGSDEIKIEIERGGTKKIKVSDNGKGMSEDDALLCFHRHATSKISDEKDLFNIDSLGFRGEALASVSEISNVKITTKANDEKTGNLIEIESGKVIKNETIGCSDGTIIEVNDLFFNVPARKKYLRSEEIEFSHILDIVTRYALLHNDRFFLLKKDGKEMLYSQKTEHMLNNIAFIYGSDTAKDLIEVDHEEEGIRLRGYISKPNLTRGDKKDQSIYINGRYVKSKTISDALYDAYKTMLFINRHPVFVLKMEIGPGEIDVNVHPAKTTIRIRDEDKVERVVWNAIKTSLMKNDLIREAGMEKETSQKAVKNYSFSPAKQTTLAVNDAGSEYSSEDNPLSKFANDTEKKPAIGNFHILGQINKTYIIAENKNGLVMIDQHAAEERINYEKFMKEMKEKAVKTQSFISPKIIELDPVKYRIALNNKDFLERMGFNFEPFGENSIKLSAVPEIFGRLRSTLFIDILNEIADSKKSSIDDEIEERIIRFSCRASVKAGDEMSTTEMKMLLKSLEECDNPYNCPHGRPTMLSFGIADLEKKFKRTGW